MDEMVELCMAYGRGVDVDSVRRGYEFYQAIFLAKPGGAFGRVAQTRGRSCRRAGYSQSADHSDSDGGIACGDRGAAAHGGAANELGRTIFRRGNPISFPARVRSYP